MLSQAAVQTNERWQILALATATNAISVAMASMCLPVLFKEISSELNLNLVQVGLIWGLGALPGILAALAGGPLSDHFGSKRVLIAATILAGLAGGLRGLSFNFASLLATVMLFSLFSSLIPLNVTKICGMWFSRRELGLAMGVVSMGMAFGFLTGSMISATYLSPWLGGWRNVLFLYGGISVALSLPWYLSPAGSFSSKLHSGVVKSSSIWSTLTHAAHVRNVWLLGLALLGINGAVQAVLGYLPLYLRNLGWPSTSADGALSLFHLVSMVFVVPIALWSDRLGSRKPVLLLAAFMFTLGFGLLFLVTGPVIWLAVAISGLVRDGFMAVLFTMVNESEGIGPALSGSAIGIVIVFSSVGSIIAPPFGNSLARMNASLPFLAWVGMVIIGSIGLVFAHERK